MSLLLRLPARSRGLCPQRLCLASFRLLNTSTTSTSSAPASGRDLISSINTSSSGKRSRERFGQRKSYPQTSRFSRSDDESALNIVQPVKYNLHVQASPNNTILNLTKGDGHRTKHGLISSGLIGFKKVQRGQFEAGFQCAIKAIRRIEEEEKATRVAATGIMDRTYKNAYKAYTDAEGKRWIPNMEIEVHFKGFGQGRDALFQALLTSEGQAVRPLISKLTDRTPIKVGGTRSKKARRL